MKKLLLFLSLVVVFVLATPASAGRPQPVGETLGWDVTEWYPDTPFNLSHGWILNLPDEGPIRSFGFKLELDGGLLMPDFIQREINDEMQYSKIHVYNFPDGMTGEHTFTGHYYAPCYLYFDDCVFPKKRVEVSTESQTITFNLTPP